MTELAPEDHEALPPAATSASIRFPCRNCGALLRWDPDVDALACEHCGARVPVERGAGAILERPLAEAAGAEQAVPAPGFDGLAGRCEHCGAQVAFHGVTTSTACVFCGAPVVLAQSAHRRRLVPESLIPLDVGRASVEREFRAWLKGLWFRPSALARANFVEALGVYLPCWTFDCQVQSSWTALAGYYYYETQTYIAMVNGRPTPRTRQVRKTRWVPASGRRADAFDDLQLLASKGVSEELAAKLGSFDTKALVPYRPEYLAGWGAEEYAIDLDAAWKLALGRVEAQQQQRCSQDVPGDTQASLRVHNDISGVRWKQVLLPLWVLNYRWHGKPYSVLIHGQTGRVVGDAPLSWVKITALVLGVAFLIVCVLGIVALRQA